MIRRLYDWMLGLAEHPAALWWLAIIAFVESSFFPIPPDIMLIPMVLAVRQKAWLIAGVCTVASVFGGLAGYGLGLFFFDAFGQALIDFYGYAEQFDRFQEVFDEMGFMAVIVFGVTVLPFKVITITAGFMELNVLQFTLASIVARAARFFLVAALLWKFGEPIKLFIEKYMEWLALAAVIVLVGGFVAIKYLL
ncbi:MAG: DedA family protein [Alphaproteobacteria bacterium]|nr:MAG: DedA family protein [Alphaproteobacteria bacterium]